MGDGQILIILTFMFISETDYVQKQRTVSERIKTTELKLSFQFQSSQKYVYIFLIVKT